jgi:hypothetical protein
MSCDKLVFDLSQEIEGSPSVFVKKDWLNILDNQNSNYQSSQSVVDTSQLSNSNKYMSYREAYLSVPLLMTLIGPGVWSGEQATAGNFNEPALSSQVMSLKSWFGNIINSFTLDLNGTTIIQQTPYINMYNCFRLLTSLSYGDILTQGSTIGFYPDDPLAFSFEPSTNANPPVGTAQGQGTCNNQLYLQPNRVYNGQEFSLNAGNIGANRRSQYISYQPTVQASQSGGSPYSGLLSAQSAQTVYKSFVSNVVAGVDAGATGVLQISVRATIYLKHIHQFFAMIPLVKGIFFKMTMNLNNSACQIAVVNPAGAGVPSAQNGTSLTSIGLSQNPTNAVGGVFPLMIASGRTNNPSTTLGTGAYRAEVVVGQTPLDPVIRSQTAGSSGLVGSSVFLYCPAYTFNPSYEQSLLSSPIKQIKYDDVYQYQVLNVPAGQPFNNLLTNGIAGIKSVLIIPFFSQSATNGNYNTATGLPLGVPVWQSPFDPAGCGATSPLVQLSNFNVVVSGQNSIYNQQRYEFEQWNNQSYGQQAVNGGLTDGLTSGLINSLGFSMEYCYYYVNVSRMLPVEVNVPKAIQIIGQNMSAKPVDLFCFISYSIDVSIDLLSGSRV